MSKRCSDEPSEASFFHGGRWVSIDEETRPIRTRPRIGTVSIPISRCRSTVCATHGAPAAGRRFARREFARQPSLRETQEWEGGGLPRVQPFLGVFTPQKKNHVTRTRRARRAASRRPQARPRGGTAVHTATPVRAHRGGAESQYQCKVRFSHR